MHQAGNVKQRFLDFRRRVYLAHDLAAVGEYVHSEFKSHNPLIAGLGVRAYRAFIATSHEGLPTCTPGVSRSSQK